MIVPSDFGRPASGERPLRGQGTDPCRVQGRCCSWCKSADRKCR